MHMSDALLSPVVGGAMYAVSAVSIAYAVQKVKKDDLGEKNLPMMAVAGAFTFAAQMINFTIPGTGSSGHIGGGILLVGLLGGTPAVVTLTAVLLIQCLFFADGGLLALGANIFNMGVIPCLFVCPLIFRPILRKGVTHKRIMIASVVSCVVGLQLGAFCVVLQTLASGVTELPFHTFVLLMQPIHLAIGFVEGIITAGILNFVYQMRPEILTDVLERLEKPVERIRYIEEADKGRSDSVSAKKVILLFAVLAILVGGGLSLYASANPDGLEWSVEKTAGVAELKEQGSVQKALGAIQQKISILPDYDFKDGRGKGTSFAGVTGAGITCLLIGAAGWGISRAKGTKSTGEEKARK